MQTKSNSIIKKFAYGGYLHSVGAVSAVFVSAVLLGIKITWDGLLAVYLFVQPIYSYDRLAGLKKDFLTNPERSQYVQKSIKTILFIIISHIMLFVGLLLYFGKIFNLIFGLGLLAFGLLYNKYFKKITKKIIAFKNFFVATFWVLFVLFMAVYYSFPLTNLGLLLILIFVFLKTLIMQIFFDIKDIESDKKENLLTLPIILGKEKITKLLNIGAIISALPIIIGFTCLCCQHILYCCS
jgi:4-hydroxybenzoate polyprenyltransferase